MRKSSGNQAQILTILLHHFSPSNSLALKVSLKIITIMQESNWSSKRTNNNNHLTLFIKRSVQSRLEYFFFLSYFFFFMTMMKREIILSLSKYTQEDSYILQKLVKLEQDLVTLDDWILMNVSIKMFERTLLGNSQIMA